MMERQDDRENHSQQKRSRSSETQPASKRLSAAVSQHTEAQGGRDRLAVAVTPRRIDYENGVIRNVRLENFKNHGHFTLALGPHANFIKGANGSGKSSILAAIIVGLGGNPNKHSGALPARCPLLTAPACAWRTPTLQL